MFIGCLPQSNVSYKGKKSFSFHVVCSEPGGAGGEGGGRGDRDGEHM